MITCKITMNNKISLPPIKDLLNEQQNFQKPNLPVPVTSHFNFAPFNPLNNPLNATVNNVLLSKSNMAHSLTQSSNKGNYYYNTPQSNMIYKVDTNDSDRSPSLSASSVSPMSSTPPSLSDAPSPDSDKSGRRKTRNNLPKETTYILLKWLSEHLNHPYPNSFEKSQLMSSTGLNQQQLSNWFINARRRKIKILKEQQRLSI